MNISRHTATGIVVATEGLTVVAITPLPDASVWQRFNRSAGASGGASWFSPSTAGAADPLTAQLLEAAYQASYNPAESWWRWTEPVQPARASRLASVDVPAIQAEHLDGGAA